MAVIIFMLLSYSVNADNSILPDRTDSVKEDSGSYSIIIDAGHGGADGGATGLNGAVEKEINLAVARITADLLRVFGYDVIMTRNDDIMLGNGEKGRAKLYDLKYRLEMADKYPNSIFVSIHVNKFPLAYCRGMTLYYSANNPESLALARNIFDANKTYLQNDNSREIKKATSSIYILDRIQIPAVLVECGFVSNEEESALLMDESYRRKLAMIISSSSASFSTDGKQ